MDETLIKKDVFCPYIKPNAGISYCLGGNCGIFDKDHDQCAVMTMVQAVTKLVEVEDNERTR